MDYFAQLIENKASSSETISVRKVYVNEDPNSEETAPCPKCMTRNQQSSVRYMFVNLQEAIYKCESPFCMYPFQNFKFKNYTDNTVYYYTSATEETPPAFEDFSTAFTFDASPPKGTHEKQNVNGTLPQDFSIHFLSPEHSHSKSKPSAVSPGINIFDSPTLCYKNLIQDFDTGFIDDILQDLNQPSPEIKPMLPCSPSPVMQNNPSTTNRQLKRCLQMFKDASISTENVFKVPPLPGSEAAIPANTKSKKTFPLRRHKHIRKIHPPNSSSPEKFSRKRRIKPLDFIESMNTIKSKQVSATEPILTGVKTLKNQRVERMLNFIERSMKKRESTPEATAVQDDGTAKHSLTQPIKKYRRHIQSKHLSLSAAVLQDSQFDYSTSESEQDDTPDSTSTNSVNNDSVSISHLPQDNDPKHSLPSFEVLLQHINPISSKTQSSHEVTAIGFRSAGSSPTRAHQWESTPPRRIHSMESLSSLLE